MLDLNIASSESSSSQIEIQPNSVANEDSSNSSSVCEEDEMGFRFLKEREGEEERFVTKEFFPMEKVVANDEVAVKERSYVDLTVDNQPRQSPTVKKSRRGPRSKSSQYRGVTFYRRTGRWESHIWDCGKQVYLGGFDTAHAAARAYDRAAIKFRGVDADINFTISDYDDDLQQMRDLCKDEFVHILRRQSTGFSRGSSKYRGVTLHKCGRWEARMGQFLGKKAYDKAAIKFNGKEAVTNFEPCSYEREGTGEAIGHELDLNLRISQPNVSSPKKNDNQKGLQFNFGTLGAFDSRRSGIGHSSSIRIGHPHSSSMTTDRHESWTYPSFYQANEESATDKITARLSWGASYLFDSMFVVIRLVHCAMLVDMFNFILHRIIIVIRLDVLVDKVDPIGDRENFDNSSVPPQNRTSMPISPSIADQQLQQQNIHSANPQPYVKPHSASPFSQKNTMIGISVNPRPSYNGSTNSLPGLNMGNAANDSYINGGGQNQRVSTMSNVWVTGRVDMISKGNLIPARNDFNHLNNE